MATLAGNLGHRHVHHLFRQHEALDTPRIYLVHEEAVVIEGKVEVAKILVINCVIDHMY